MSIAANSVVIQWVLSLWRALIELWQQSGVGRWFQRAERAVSSSAAHSSVCRFLVRDGAVLRSWPDSIICRLAAMIVNIPCALFRWMYKIARDLWDGSVAFHALSALGNAAWIPMGLLMLVMLCAPHSLWDNRYAFLGMILVTGVFLVGCMGRGRQRLQVERLGP